MNLEGIGLGSRGVAGACVTPICLAVTVTVNKRETSWASTGLSSKQAAGAVTWGHTQGEPNPAQYGAAGLRATPRHCSLGAQAGRQKSPESQHPLKKRIQIIST